jgi:[ribosomal protein S5]-alanine N-acetyltransferase
MIRDNSISIDQVKGSLSEYIIREGSGITIGRVFIIELSKENRYCLMRLKFYKTGEECSEYLRGALNMFLLSLFKNMNIYKVDVLVDEEICIEPFTQLGFELEGIIINCTLTGNVFRDELMFGVDIDTFNNINRRRSLLLKGKNIELKVLNPENTKEVLDFYIKNKEYLKPFEPLRESSFYTLEAQRASIIEGYKQYLNGTSVNMGIFRDNKFIGKIRISNVVIGSFKSATIGYSIDEGEQGKGYMKEACNLAVGYAFEEMGLHRIEGSTLVDNIKSQRVLRSCGFKELGLNEKYLYINGQWRDHITFYKVKED